MVDPAIEQSLESFGYAEVLAVLDEPSAAAALESADAAEAVLEHFLPRPPEAAVGVRALEEDSEPVAASYFPELGVAVGFVDASGSRALEASDSVEAVYRAEPLSLIRPVRMAVAASTSEFTWGLRNLKVQQLWDQGLTGAGIRVGHLDTGVDGDHPALRGQIGEFAEFDSLGKIVPGSSAHDSDDHGTHTAATICGGTVDGMAVGVAPGAALFSGMVIEGGRPLLRVLAGMDWALGRGVQILSMSLGFRVFTPFLVDITRRLRTRGVLPVFALGNEGVGTSRSPGNYAEALSVGAFDENGRVARFSSSITFNRPLDPDQPDVVAPGVDVISARPGGGVQSMDGTSMATPHVAGVAALLWEAKPDATVDELEGAIRSTATRLPSVPVKRQGNGAIDPVAALESLTSQNDMGSG